MFLDYCTLFNGILDFFLIKTLNFCIILDFCILLLLTDNMQKSRFNCIFKIIYGKYLWDNAKLFMVNIYGNVWENHLYLYLNDGFQKLLTFKYTHSGGDKNGTPCPHPSIDYDCAKADPVPDPPSATLRLAPASVL